MAAVPSVEGATRIRWLEDANDARRAPPTTGVDTEPSVVDRLHGAVPRLRAAGAVDQVLRQAAIEIPRVCGLRRGLVSTVDGSTWQPRWSWTDGDATATQIHDVGVPLATPLAEAEVVRRRSPLLLTDPVGDPRAHQPLVLATRTRGYVVAPVVVGETVTALLHGDRADLGVDSPDRDPLRLLADILGLVLEHITLAEQLDHRRALIVAALDESSGALTGYATTPMGLSRSTELAASSQPAPATTRGAHDSRFTGRQREVLDLVLTGATNREIAERLTVAETTVKSHVRQILRKLGATSRAEAVARYLHAPHGRPKHT